MTLSLLLGMSCASEGGQDGSDNEEQEEVVPDVTPAATGSMIIDHRCTDLDDVPLEWIDRAGTDLHIAYGHTSHGSQITTGMTGLASFAGAPHGGSAYAWNEGGTDGALDLDDSPFSGASDLGNPNRTAWADATRAYLSANPDVNVIVWSWCGQADGSEADIQTYLDLMSELEEDYPGVSFVYMTGHTNGSGLTGNLHLRNQQIRDYCAAHSQPLNANLKAFAAWWLWARLAGWDGA